MKIKVFKAVIVVLALLFSSSLCIAASQTASGKTTTDITTSVRYYINEETAVFWTDTEILSYINDAVTNIVTLSGTSDIMEQQTIISGQTEYSISANYVNIKDVLYTSASGNTDYKALLLGDRAKIGHATAGTFSNPVYYYEFNGQVGVYPLEGSATGSTIYVYLNGRSNDLSSGDTLTTPSFFDRAIIYYATAQALYKDRQFKYANLFMTQYYFDIKFYVENIMDKPQDLLDQIRGRRR